MNFNSPDWKEVEARLKDQIAKLDVQNRAPQLDAHQTATIRGQIRALQDVLRWPKEEEATVNSDNEVNLLS